MPSRSGSSRGGARVLGAIVGAALAYATVRYCVFGNVGLEEFPLYISNKGVSAGALGLIALAYLANRFMPLDPSGRDARRRLARSAGLAGFWLALLHSLVSLPILTASRYPTLFDQTELSAIGLACLLLGVLALGLFAVPAVFSTPARSREGRSDRWLRAQQLGYFGLAATAAHVGTLGYSNWTNISAWPGGLPPISLLSFVVCVVPILAKVVSIQWRDRPLASGPRPARVPVSDA